MALSSEHREIWVAEVQTAREDVAEDTFKKARPFPDQVAKVAVADHLAAVEVLLGEIALLPDSRAGHIASHPEQTLAEYIRALLGPAATKED